MDYIKLISENVFLEFTVILALAALLGALGMLMRQPLIVMFIALGVIVGPSLLDIVHSKDNVHLLAEVGIALLLFIVGLKLDIRIIKSVGKIAALTGLGQVLFTSLIGYFISIALGFEPLHSFYIAVALTFSSTIIIVKLLSDKKEIDSLHGQIAIGFLIVQDIVVILVMIVLSAIGQQNDQSLLYDFGKTLLSGSILLLFAILVMRYVIPGLSSFMAKSPEMLTLFAIAWAVSMASIGELMGFSSEVGAFLAGFTLASSDFKDVISSRLTSLRDFLLLFFFVNLGAELDLNTIGAEIPSALVLSVFVLVGNPLIVLVIMGSMGYRKRTSFLAGLTVAQISEFSLIFAGLGLAIGHITEQVVGLITLVGLITIGLSTYLILYSHPLFEWLSPVLSIFEKKNPFREEQFQQSKISTYDIIVIGAGRFGSKLCDMLNSQAAYSYLCIDFDPDIVKKEVAKGHNVAYGDAEDPALFEHLPLQAAKAVVCTIPITLLALDLLSMLRHVKYQGKIFLTASGDNDIPLLQQEGVQRIIVPHTLAANAFFNQLEMELD